MPVSSAKMTISARMMLISSSDTRDERLLVHHLGQLWVLARNVAADCFEIARHPGLAALCRQLGGNLPVGAGVRRWRGPAFLVLHTPFQVQQGALALVGVR